MSPDEIRLRLREAGKTQKWLADQLALGQRTVRAYLSPSPRNKTQRMQRVVELAIQHVLSHK